MVDNNELSDWVKKFLEEEEHFNKEVYPKMSFDEKVNYWANALHDSMRLRGSNGYGQKVAFTPEWHQEMLEYDPDFDLIMDVVFEKKWELYWDKNEYLKGIGKM